MFTQFLREEKGQTTVEYLLIIAVIVVVVSVLGKGLRDQLPQTIQQIFGQMNSQIKNMMSKAAQ
jgi:Flp pilus assembly pilin Flp